MSNFNNRIFNTEFQGGEEMTNRIIRLHAVDQISGEEVYVRYDADAKIMYDDTGTYTSPHQLATLLKNQTTAVQIEVVSDA